MTAQTSFTLVNPQSGNLAFRIHEFEDDSYFREQKKAGYYSIVLVTKGRGLLKADFSEYDFNENALMCFSLYQPFIITAGAEFQGILINFHPDFFCIYKHQKEITCDGVLFNNIYASPLIAIQHQEMVELLALVAKLKSEMLCPDLAQYELLVAYLKIFLIKASRYKTAQQPTDETKLMDKEPFILKNLQDAIDEHYKTKRSPADYADLLNISMKALNRLSKTHFKRTVSNLIAERIVIEAKRELYLTSKPVKRIAYELGFNDEFYFSRFFKTNAEVAPQVFRETVGFARGEE
ncbi:helix-turn-helix domain-containing protein [Pedobacter sp. SYSU D00535]|uniref:helix-turn-helix domain-containing protein n=1 Tax=Pedobacter sp. SYSU D00535 TaxID=2810308 RepID=UPI001A965F34|nr:helix-turn-helix domain-containing protein [Pedobacter sp. SYSU D00535]